MIIPPPFTPTGFPRWAERWSLLIMREIAAGNNRFDGIASELKIARNILSVRLKWLVEDGLGRKSRYTDRPPRHEYHLAPAGHDALAVLNALTDWNHKHGGASGSA